MAPVGGGAESLVHWRLMFGILASHRALGRQNCLVQSITRSECFVLAGVSFWLSGMTIVSVFDGAPIAVGLALVGVALVFGATGSRDATGVRTGVWTITILASTAPWLWFIHDARALLIIVLGAATLIDASRGVRVAIVALLFAVILTAVAPSFHWGSSDIDFYPVLQQGSSDVLHGIDPYRRMYRLLLVGAYPEPQYGFFPPPYGPAVFLQLAPLRFLGDVRFTEGLYLAAVGYVILAAARRTARPTDMAALTAVVLASPMGFLMFFSGWVEPLSVLTLAIWWQRRHGSAAWGLLLIPAIAGRFTVLILIVPLVAWDRRTWRSVAIGIGGAVLVAAPFIVDLGLPGFLTAQTVVLGTAINPAPQRTSVTFDAVLYLLGLTPYSRGVGLILTVVATAAVVTFARGRRDADRTALGVVASVAVFLFAPYAHINYFWPLGVWMFLLAFDSTTEKAAQGTEDRARAGVAT